MSGLVRLRHLALAAVVVAGLVLFLEPAPVAAAPAGQVILVSHTAVGPATAPVGSSYRPSVSANGAFELFESTATNLVAGQSDANGGSDVFVFERATGAVTLVSHTPANATTTANGRSSGASISANGAFVVFGSYATNLVAGQSDFNAADDLFLFERATGLVTLVSHNFVSATTTAGSSVGVGSGEHATISADGAFVAFQSDATDLVAAQSDTNATADVFLFDRATGAVTLVSHIPVGATTTANGVSYSPFISADGAFVAFQSPATNLVAGQSDFNATADVFLFERATGAVTLVSHNFVSATTTANSSIDTNVAAFSGDGAFVAFQSDATDLVAAQSDTNAAYDVFLFDRATGTVSLVSHTPASATTTANSDSNGASMSADGSFVVFQSAATNLVAGQSDANADYDVFLFERATRTVTLMSPTPASATTTANRVSDGASISADGAFVVFVSAATNLVAGQSDANGGSDVFLFERATGTVSLVSHTPAGAATTANGFSPSASISGDGAFVAFASYGTNLVAGQSDANGDSDVFLYQRTSVHQPVVDYNGDGKTDIAVFRPSSGVWYVSLSGGGSVVAPWGTSGDVAVPGDYNGDGKTDIAVFRPSSGVWYVSLSGGGSVVAPWGTSGDVPIERPIGT